MKTILAIFAIVLACAFAQTNACTHGSDNNADQCAYDVAFVAWTQGSCSYDANGCTQTCVPAQQYSAAAKTSCKASLNSVAGYFGIAPGSVDMVCTPEGYYYVKWCLA